jgi:mono/diheme cytochrome c family protein
LSGSGALAVRPPPSVARAGGSQLAEFNLGRAVVEQSGCLACHRIGEQGSGAPGPALTHIGSMMPERVIERVLIDAEPPMPSFGHLPREEFRALVWFLTLLRCPGARRGLSPHGC